MRLADDFDDLRYELHKKIHKQNKSLFGGFYVRGTMIFVKTLIEAMR